MTAKTYSDEEISYFYEQYKELGISVAGFARKLQLSEYSLRRGFQRLELQTFPLEIVKRKYALVSNFFEDINTQEKAYCLGFIFADGCNTGRRLEISLAKQDRDILERISSLLFFGQVNIKEYASKHYGRQDRVAIYVTNKKICEDLSKWGCVPRKTFVLKFPEVHNSFISHFMRGFFDGDGSLSILQRQSGYNEAHFSIVSTMEMLQEIGRIICRDAGVQFKISKRHKERKNNNFTLRVSGNRQIERLCDYLYRESTICLNRKFNTYQALKEINRNQDQKNVDI